MNESKDNETAVVFGNTTMPENILTGLFHIFLFSPVYLIFYFLYTIAEDKSHPIFTVFGLIVSFIILSFIGDMFLSHREKIIVTQSKVVLDNVFGKKEMLLADLRKVYASDDWIFLSAEYKKMGINNFYFKSDKEICEFLILLKSTIGPGCEFVIRDDLRRMIEK